MSRPFRSVQSLFAVSLFLSCWHGRALPVLRAGESADATRSIAGPYLLRADDYRHYIETFNANDNERYGQYVPNAAAWSFLNRNIPLLDCPDCDIREIYYFRWWTFRKHIKLTPDGFIITEFLPPVSWSGKHNSINCAAGHHLAEGRWLQDERFLDEYSRFWFRKGGDPRAYSFWAAAALWSRFLVTGDDRVLKELFADLVANDEAWDKSHRDPNGLYWQSDDRDGMEVSIGGSGYRATINSYMYGDALALAHMAERFQRPELAARFRAKAAAIQGLTQQRLWDPAAQFFKVRPRGENFPLADVRELHGYTPWYFNLPDADKTSAWRQCIDPQGFRAPFGLTTAERRHAKFSISYQGHECQWNGPVWPYATSITLTAMANLLNDYKQDVVRCEDYYVLLKTYARAQHRKLPDGRTLTWIDENLNPDDGDWISRTMLQRRKNDQERGKDYNHSTFCDLVISGLVGLRPRQDDVVEVNPLVPSGAWDYFCLDRIPYHGHSLTIFYDSTGRRYGKGRGLRLWADGREMAAADRLMRLVAQLPSASRGHQVKN